MEVAEEERAKEIILSGVRLNTYSYHTHNKETTPPPAQESTAFIIKTGKKQKINLLELTGLCIYVP